MTVFEDVVDEVDRVVEAIAIPGDATGLARMPYHAARTADVVRGNSGHRAFYHDDATALDELEVDERVRVRYAWDLVVVLVVDGWDMREQPRAIVREAHAVKAAISNNFVPPTNADPVLVQGHRTTNILGTNQVEVQISLVVEVLEDLTP